MLPYLFSLLKGTKLESYRYGIPSAAKTINKKGDVLFDVHYIKGWILFMGFGSNNPYMTIRYEIDEFKMDFISPLTLYLTGRWLPASQLWWLDRYSVDDTAFVCETQPTPWIPYRDHYYVEMFIHKDSPVDEGTLIGAQFEVAQIIDDGLFIKSLQAILGVKQSQSILNEVGLGKGKDKGRT